MKCHIRHHPDDTTVHVTNNGAEWTFDGQTLDITVEGVPLGIEALVMRYRARTDLLFELAAFLRFLPAMSGPQLMQERAALEEKIGRLLEGNN